MSITIGETVIVVEEHGRFALLILNGKKYILRITENGKLILN